MKTLTAKEAKCRFGRLIDLARAEPVTVAKHGRYARRVEMDEIEANDFNLNISRYVSTSKEVVAIDLSATHKELVEIEKQIRESTAKHNEFLKELGLSPLPAPDQ
jgi:type I restriction enzyme M protein